MLIAIAVFAPLLGAVIAGLARPFVSKQAAIGASILFMVVSAICGVGAFIQFRAGGVALDFRWCLHAGLVAPAGYAVAGDGRDGQLRVDADPCLQRWLYGA
jgi:NADH:ubiquinone oxidoreductase subunit 5 (subunit L)/multisubunit Na+/H+ antiporter MnhA subunit